MNITFSIVAIGGSLLVLSPWIFARRLVKFTFWHKPLGKDEWKYAERKVEPLFPGTTAWVKAHLADGSMKEETLDSRGNRVHAYYLPHPEAQGTVVLTHGYSGCALQMMPYARVWHEELGYNVLVHDLPNHGKSSGNITCMGKVEYLDLLRWAKRAEELFPGTEICLHGISMGAATTLMALGHESLPASVKAGIADSPFMRVGNEVLEQTNSITKGLLPQWYLKLVMWFTERIMRKRCGWSLWEDPSPFSAAGQIRVPVMFICDSADKRVSNAHSQMLFDATNPSLRHIFRTSGQGHCRSILGDKAGYLQAMKTVIAFVPRR